MDPEDSTWKRYGDVGQCSATSDNFSVSFWEPTVFRLEMVGGPLARLYIQRSRSAALTHKYLFANWGGMSGDKPYVGTTFTGHALAKRIVGDSNVENTLSYQWYRVDPVTFALEEIFGGATSTQYTVQTEDAGYRLLLRASGDGQNIGGFMQILLKLPGLAPNKAFINDVTSTGFILNLHKNVPAAGLKIMYN